MPRFRFRFFLLWNLFCLLRVLLFGPSFPCLSPILVAIRFGFFLFSFVPSGSLVLVHPLLDFNFVWMILRRLDPGFFASLRRHNVISLIALGIVHPRLCFLAAVFMFVRCTTTEATATGRGFRLQTGMPLCSSGVGVPS